MVIFKDRMFLLHSLEVMVFSALLSGNNIDLSLEFNNHQENDKKNVVLLIYRFIDIICI
jgi:hypothetical protein